MSDPNEQLQSALAHVLEKTMKAYADGTLEPAKRAVIEERLQAIVLRTITEIATQELEETEGPLYVRVQEIAASTALRGVVEAQCRELVDVHMEEVLNRRVEDAVQSFLGHWVFERVYEKLGDLCNDSFEMPRLRRDMETKLEKILLKLLKTRAKAQAAENKLRRER